MNVRHTRSLRLTVAAALLFAALVTGVIFVVAPLIEAQRLHNPAPQVSTSGCWTRFHSPIRWSGLAALSLDDVWAAGSVEKEENRNGIRTLTMHWNGAEWQVVPTPNMASNYRSSDTWLEDITAIAPNDAWAVGAARFVDEQYPLYPGLRGVIMHWDGGRWSALPDLPVPSLYRVSALSADDVWVVGNDYNVARGTEPVPSVLHWDGKSWTPVLSDYLSEPPTGYSLGELYDIAPLSGSDIWVVGSETLAHWDGKVWSRLPRSGYSELKRVAAVSPTDIWAVGSDKASSVIMHWDGKSWTKVAGPEVGPLYDLAVVSASDVWATGRDTLVHWDGHQWNTLGVPDLPPTTRLHSLAVAGTDLWVLGHPNEDGPVGPRETVIVRYDLKCPGTTP